MTLLDVICIVVVGVGLALGAVLLAAGFLVCYSGSFRARRNAQRRRS